MNHQQNVQTPIVEQKKPLLQSTPVSASAYQSDRLPGIVIYSKGRSCVHSFERLHHVFEIMLE
jgi:hypothetical protein